jgi:hypothetical protein
MRARCTGGSEWLAGYLQVRASVDCGLACCDLPRADERPAACCRGPGHSHWLRMPCCSGRQRARAHTRAHTRVRTHARARARTHTRSTQDPVLARTRTYGAAQAYRKLDGSLRGHVRKADVLRAYDPRVSEPGPAQPAELS